MRKSETSEWVSNNYHGITIIKKPSFITRLDTAIHLVARNNKTKLEIVEFEILTKEGNVINDDIQKLIKKIENILNKNNNNNYFSYQLYSYQLYNGTLKKISIGLIKLKKYINEAKYFIFLKNDNILNLHNSIKYKQYKHVVFVFEDGDLMALKMHSNFNPTLIYDIIKEELIYDNYDDD